MKLALLCIGHFCNYFSTNSNELACNIGYVDMRANFCDLPWKKNLEKIWGRREIALVHKIGK